MNNISPRSVKKGIGGWLLLFILTLVMLKPIATFMYMKNLSSIVGIVGEKIPWLRTYMIMLFSVEAFITLAGVVAGVLLLLIKKNAIKFTKIYLVSYAISIFSLYLVLYIISSSIGADKKLISTLASRQFLQSILYCGIWFGFIINSERIRNTYNYDNKLIEVTK